tara:strand:- start:3292 stop:3576 length:285 start_codon:yes stop_codon:yes gene_type:complete
VFACCVRTLSQQAVAYHTYESDYFLKTNDFAVLNALRKLRVETGLSRVEVDTQLFICQFQLDFQNAKSATNILDSASCLDKMLRLAQAQLITPR